MFQRVNSKETINFISLHCDLQIIFIFVFPKPTVYLELLLFVIVESIVNYCLIAANNFRHA